MTKQTITLHMYQSTADWNRGDRSVHDADFRNSPEIMHNRVYLGSQDVEIDWPEIDTTAAEIDVLQDQIKQARKQVEQTQNLLLERISKLRATGHEVVQ